jgi:very-short-patch-repair endonuclease
VDDIPLGTSYTWTDARARGVTRRQIQADGVQIGRGLYVSRAVDLSLPERCGAWARVLPGDAAFGLHTAVALYGADSSRDDAVHVVLRPRRVLPQHAGLTVHARTLEDVDTVEFEGLRLTSGAQTFLDMAPLLWAPDLMALGDALMRRGVLDGAALAARLLRADRVRGVVRARGCAPHLTAAAGSHPESRMRYHLLASELPDPEVQVAVHDRWGREVAHADLGYSRWKVALEYEGRQHAEPEQFDRDVDRYSLFAASGWLVLRFARRHQPTTVVDRTRRALVSRGWQPGLS